MITEAAARVGYYVALPTLALCPVLLTLDLGQPLRFWHMIFQSENFPVPILKAYSPMSLGSAVLAIFGLIAFISFLDAVLSRNRAVHGRDNLVGKIISVLGAIAGLTLAGYTGVLVNVTNEPVWGNSPWLGALFLFSGVSTGIALLMVVGRRVPVSTVEKLSEADNYMMIFELISLVVFVATLGAVGLRFIFGAPALILFLVVVVLGLLVPLAIHWRPSLAGGARGATIWSSVLVLIGGFVLRWAVLAGPQGIGL